ncbi:nucleotidyltransferase family protein, partial [Candidatus Dependentiae bacterium]|nr:nucleotidyltransferase family protein [Candidatus Dependentiae bacterium]
MNYLKVKYYLITLLNIILNEDFGRKIKLPFSEEDFINVAGKEGVLNFIYYYLCKEHQVLEFSSTTVKKLEEYFFMISAINIELQKNLSEFIKISREKDLKEFILFKGGHLINEIYTHPATRPMGDIDILYSQDIFNALKELLLELGFVYHRDSSQGHNFKKGDRIIFDLVEYEGDFYVGELKKKLSPINYEAVLDSTHEIEIDGNRVKVLTNEMNLLLLSDHMRKHYYNRLIWFLDFILTYKKSEIDYCHITNTAEKINLKKSLNYTLFTIQKYFPNQIKERNIKLSHLEMKILTGIIQEKITKGNT